VIYLVIRIFVYLLFALALGVAAGWLWRNREAAGHHGALERALMDSRARLPQMETALRASEARLDAVMAELEAREEELATRHERLTAERHRAEELERACAVLEARLEAAAVASPPPEPQADPGELERMRRALAAEQRRVEELGRERELQRGALAALEQQLELARETRPRAASG